MRHAGRVSLRQKLADLPEIIQVLKLEDERVNFVDAWHTYSEYLAQPPTGSMLLAREVSPVSGETLFANQNLTYKTLSPGLRRALNGLSTVHNSAKADVAITQATRWFRGVAAHS